jgi:hypothetical protein
MGYEKIDKTVSLAELSRPSSIENNRWENIEGLLKEHYHTGQSHEEADAYSHLMFLKGMLFQKWFHIPSDSELENQINGRISFKKFLGLFLHKTSPDHSTFSRFRSGLSKEAMTQLNNEILLQLAHKGLSINEVEQIRCGQEDMILDFRGMIRRSDPWRHTSAQA